MPEPMTLESLQALIDGSPFLRFMGLTVTSIDPEASTVVLEATLRPELERRGASAQWHGGPLAALIDSAGDYAVAVNLGAAVPTINFRVDYLRPALTATLTATARARRSGRTVAIVDIDVADAEGRLCAIGRACYSSQPG
ncbi:MAG TPA: PaaI family thioesterase [Stellaceae bacterium]|jgi:uncharacterized protein (TIGR00369 family)|nr:PaaI family thioesterase [Stellaceae bacterium]